MLEKYFAPFRENIIGHDYTYTTHFGEQKLIYADWTASGRLYAPIEQRMIDEIYPMVGNTHTETTITGCTMTHGYHEALHHIKAHVGANDDDVIISAGAGMTSLVNKFQRIMGLKIHERFKTIVQFKESERPVVFVTHMEHHSNHTSWLETLADVEIIAPNAEGLVCLNSLEDLLHKYRNRKTKIAAVTACSNVTGIVTPYHEIAELMHRHDGLCFVDFACSAPYVAIDMHPEKAMQKLDAIYFSPHKFLGGPGASGILIFNKNLYNNRIPDHPGGGTVLWTDPWGGRLYFDNIEAREDGGTPGFLQTIRSALAVKLKEEMTVDKIMAREAEMLPTIWEKFSKIDNLMMLAGEQQERMGIFSFYHPDVHYNLVVRILNDRFGVQVRSGCVCAGTYGHYLFNLEKVASKKILDALRNKDMSIKPGWVRMSINPVLSDADIDKIMTAITAIFDNYREWSKDYVYDPGTNEFNLKYPAEDVDQAATWFEKSLH
jgi:selenocysteine lyase/cysteine desulfurase